MLAAFTFQGKVDTITSMVMHPMRQDLEEILLTEDQIRHRLDELATEIQRDYVDKDLTLVAILTGSVMFTMKLLSVKSSEKSRAGITRQS